jgi:GNAT superfamily N-acetyltransferase
MDVNVKPFNKTIMDYLEKDIRRIGRQCFPEIYWEAIDTVIKECNIEASIFAFNNEGKMQGFILITDDPLDMSKTGVCDISNGYNSPCFQQGHDPLFEKGPPGQTGVCSECIPINRDGSKHLFCPPLEKGPQKHIEFVAVDAAYSGKGIGGLMMKAALLSCNTTQQDIWLDDNLPKFWLHVDTDNYHARHLYNKYGFRVWRHQPDDFGYEGDIMIL